MLPFIVTAEFEFPVLLTGRILFSYGTVNMGFRIKLKTYTYIKHVRIAFDNLF